MQKFLTDMHTHSTFSHDGRDELSVMLAAAQKAGMAFYGVSDHFDFDYDLFQMSEEELAQIKNADPEVYFHGARHLQEDYEGVMNVCVGAEFGYSDKAEVKARYQKIYDKYRPDFVINSVHGGDGKDFARYIFTEDKKSTYRSYLGLIRRSLDVEYPYDVVGHIGYIARYVPYEDKRLSLAEFGEEIDDILKTIIQKGKILEVNSANKGLQNRTLPAEEIVQRYYDLGGRKVSFGSDAHFKERIADKREEVVEMLKKIGFTHLTVPFRGEHIAVLL
ncbi:MAG: histidinol-phosphatase HisJ family protein [Clostridia bacterium]|nr:histidinol-phosphatase HisJ family protein [Clostridia bacterium]